MVKEFTIMESDQTIKISGKHVFKEYMPELLKPWTWFKRRTFEHSYEYEIEPRIS